MSIQDVGTQIEAQVNDVLSRLQSKQFFQSDWDIATFAIFFIFIGAVLFLLLLVLAQCCYGCCCGSSRSKEVNSSTYQSNFARNQGQPINFIRKAQDGSSQPGTGSLEPALDIHPETRSFRNLLHSINQSVMNPLQIFHQ